MRFVKKFTPPNFQAKNFTPLFLPNFNSFGDNNTQKWVRIEKFTPLAKILHCRRQWRQWQIPPLPQKKSYLRHSQNWGRGGPAQVDLDIFLKVWGDGGFPSVFSEEFGDKGAKWLQHYIGGYTQVITILNRGGGGGVSRDPQKWLPNMCRPITCVSPKRSQNFAKKLIINLVIKFGETLNLSQKCLPNLPPYRAPNLLKR